MPEELDNEYVINKLPEIYKNRNLETLVDNKGEYWLQYTLENQSKKFNDKNRPNLAYPIFINKDENHNLYHTIEPIRENHLHFMTQKCKWCAICMKMIERKN